jgi:hypothetical protein
VKRELSGFPVMVLNVLVLFSHGHKTPAGNGYPQKIKSPLVMIREKMPGYAQNTDCLPARSSLPHSLTVSVTVSYHPAAVIL